MSKQRLLFSALLIISWLFLSSNASAQSDDEPVVRDETLCRDVVEGCEETDSTSPAQPSIPEIVGPPPRPTEAPRPLDDSPKSADEGVVRLVFFWSDT